MKKNKLYFVYESYENTGVIVSAPTNREAKLETFNSGNDPTNSDFLALRCHMIRSGQFYPEDDECSPYFNVLGKGPVFTELPTGYIEWEAFKDELKKQGRYEKGDDEE